MHTMKLTDIDLCHCICLQLWYACVYYRIDYFTLMKDKKKIDAEYLQYVTDNSFTSDTIFTSQLGDLLDKWNNTKENILINGPKGCGKTVLCAMMYQLHYDGLNCMFLSSRSLNFFSPLVNNYFKKFDDQWDDTAINLQNFLKFLLDATNSHDFTVFIDLSRFTKVEANRRQEFMEVLKQVFCKRCRMLVSVSSGGQHMSTMNQTLLFELDNILSSCCPFVAYGFTYEEAGSYWTNSEIIFDQIYPFTGLNPYLMSRVAKLESIKSASVKIDSVVKDYLCSNLGLAKDCTSVEQYFRRAEISEAAKFALYANSQSKLSDGDIELYERTWLCKYHFTVKEVQSNILRWNFPTSGPLYHDILANFISTSTDEQVKEVCIKELTFAGFWLERLFVEHHKDSTAVITVNCISRQAGASEKVVKFSKFTMAKDLDSPTLMANKLYEMKRAHETFDFVGYLTDHCNVKWLVFIQVSLQKYTNHRAKLCSIFHSAQRKKDPLYNQYRNLFAIDSEAQCDVLLLYISPKNTILENLWKNLGNASVQQTLYVGVLIQGATFYNKLHKFDEMCNN